MIVDPGISEFAFGYAFLYEQTLINWGTIVAAPILPSLRQEAELGWDVRLPRRGCDFYYQFKLSDHLKSSNAKFIADGTYSRPYYRIKLHARNFNQQHRKLWQHAQFNPNTYYVAPEFDSKEDFNLAFLNNTITEHSRLIPLVECDDYRLYDSGQHYITYQKNDSVFIQHSEPSLHKISYSGKKLKRIYDESRESWRPIDEKFAGMILEQTIEKLKFSGISENFLKFLHEIYPHEKVGKLLLSTKLLSVVYGISMVIIGERE